MTRFVPHLRGYSRFRRHDGAFLRWVHKKTGMNTLRLLANDSPFPEKKGFAALRLRFAAHHLKQLSLSAYRYWYLEQNTIPMFPMGEHKRCVERLQKIGVKSERVWITFLEDSKVSKDAPAGLGE